MMASSVCRPQRGPIGGLAAAGSHNGHCTFALRQVPQAGDFLTNALPTGGQHQGFDPLGWQHAVPDGLEQPLGCAIADQVHAPTEAEALQLKTEFVGGPGPCT